MIQDSNKKKIQAKVYFVREDVYIVKNFFTSLHVVQNVRSILEK